MRVEIIEQTDKWAIECHGGGVAYALYRKPDGAEAFLQGDDAAEWEGEYEAMQEAREDPASPWYGKTWNACLAQICGEYL